LIRSGFEGAFSIGVGIIAALMGLGEVVVVVVVVYLRSEDPRYDAGVDPG
jgi:hypothetical protein